MISKEKEEAKYIDYVSFQNYIGSYEVYSKQLNIFELDIKKMEFYNLLDEKLFCATPASPNIMKPHQPGLSNIMEEEEEVKGKNELDKVPISKNSDFELDKISKEFVCT